LELFLQAGVRHHQVAVVEHLVADEVVDEGGHSRSKFLMS
jgi:hypothetical protein